MLTEQLPIYRLTYEFVSLLYDYVAGFPRSCRFTIGERMTNEALALFVHIARANRSKELRADELREFCSRMEVLSALLRLVTEKHVITTKQAARAASVRVAIGKQVSGWMRSV